VLLVGALGCCGCYALKQEVKRTRIAVEEMQTAAEEVKTAEKMETAAGMMQRNKYGRPKETTGGGY